MELEIFLSDLKYFRLLVIVFRAHFFWMPLTVQHNENDSSNLPEIGDVIIITFNRLCSKVYERLYWPDLKLDSPGLKTEKYFTAQFPLTKCRNFCQDCIKPIPVLIFFFIIILDNGLARLALVILQWVF